MIATEETDHLTTILRPAAALHLDSDALPSGPVRKDSSSSRGQRSGFGIRWFRAAGLGIFGALFYYWQQADSFWESVGAVFPKAIFWPAYTVYEGFKALGG